MGEIHPGDKEALTICEVEHSGEGYKRRMGEQTADNES